MAVSFYRFLVNTRSLCVVRHTSLLLTCFNGEKLSHPCRFVRIRESQAKMPPKRKATEAKAAKDAEDVAAENGASGDAPISKKGKAAAKEVQFKQTASDAKPKRGRGAKAPAKEAEEENIEQPKETKTRGRKLKAVSENETGAAERETEEENLERPVEMKPKGRKLKAVTENKMEQETRVTRARATKERKTEKDKSEDKPKTAKAKKTEPKKKVTATAKPKKERPAAKTETKDDSAEEATSDSAATKNNTNTNYSQIDFACTRKNAKEDEFNLKISSWNVDGLRALVKKNGHFYVEQEDPDVLCLQEIKCKEEQLPSEIKDLETKYSAYWCSSEKDGYAGVGLLTKIKPISVEFGIGVEEHDEDGRCITAEYDKFYLVNVYVPNAGRKLVTLPKRLEWNTAFQAYIKALDKNKPVIVCGDMNVSHEEIDLANPKANKKNAGFSQEERDGMTNFLKDGYVDTYREFYPDKTGVYTFWTYMSKSRSKNVGWRLDYFIVSERFMDNICDNVVRSEVFGSDHCPITLFLNV